MPRNLDPRLDALQSTLQRGAIMRLGPEAPVPSGAAGPDNPTGNVLRFQFNPETVTRTRTGRWEPRKKRRGQTAASPQTERAALAPSSDEGRPPQQVRTRSGQGSSALLAESEQISLRVTFDATEAVLAGEAGSDQGVLPELAFLELASLGREGNPANREREAVQPVRPDELLLFLGQQRIFPVVLTGLTITEQKFLPTLVPLRAEVELKLNVLEPAESPYRRWIDAAFHGLLQKRMAAAGTAHAPGDVASAIGEALRNVRVPGSQPPARRSTTR
ncbi:MAG TPA: hypothetical protein VHE80_01410 [Acidimicrobiales bacterium]|nr:hypothetical protein [Acidimicrobiales bacterium]